VIKKSAESDQTSTIQLSYYYDRQRITKNKRPQYHSQQTFVEFSFQVKSSYKVSNGKR
jgi:hypothetical protein